MMSPDDKLTLQRKDYLGNELRTDGYYYRFRENGSTTVYFLYKNGIIKSASSYSSHDLDMVEKEMVKWYREIRKTKTGWGVFLISDNKIEHETWDNPVGRIVVRKTIGHIVNDKTFRITEFSHPYNNQTYYVDEVWHFKQFSPKPDSTNNFIK